ncbi:MAG: hypothetical protein LN413_03750 [Candidatus Thermoplasmatota archaeon]|nr:hypothetical protein [Candidatus Thermoplasmatota archaeon]
MGKDEQNIFMMTKGSRYRLTSVESREAPMRTSGVFKGFATVGTDDAVVMELDENHGEDEGRTRVIPLHMILAIDVLETAEPEEEEEETSRETMFG